jgi:broad specificity phosphatase PhoE
MFIYLIRHGQTDWNKEHRVMGRAAIPLNEEGRAGVVKLARALTPKKIPVIYASTVERALESARILAEEWGAELREEKRLNESPFESWVGRTYHELRDDEDFKLYFDAPTGAVIIITSSVVYGVCLLLSPKRRGVSKLGVKS